MKRRTFLRGFLATTSAAALLPFAPKLSAQAGVTVELPLASNITGKTISLRHAGDCFVVVRDEVERRWRIRYGESVTIRPSISGKIFVDDQHDSIGHQEQ